MSVKVSSSGSGLLATGSFSITNMTISAWVKRNGDTNSYAAMFLFVQGNGQQLAWLGAAVDGTTLGLYNGTNGLDSSDQWPTSWTYYTLVQNPTSMKFYKNGSLILDFTDPSQSGSPPSLYVFASNFDEWADAEVQDVRLWGRELSESEIQAEYASIVPVSSDALANYWPLVDHNTLTDVINGNNFSGLGPITTGDSQPPGYGSSTGPFVNNPRNLLLLF
jgi:hypothetical protein